MRIIACSSSTKILRSRGKLGLFPTPSAPEMNCPTADWDPEGARARPIAFHGLMLLVPPRMMEPLFPWDIFHDLALMPLTGFGVHVATTSRFSSSTSSFSIPGPASLRRHRSSFRANQPLQGSGRLPYWNSSFAYHRALRAIVRVAAARALL